MVQSSTNNLNISYLYYITVSNDSKNFKKLSVICYDVCCVMPVCFLITGAADMGHVDGNKTRKSMQRNVRSKRTVTSRHERLVHDDTEPIRPEQRLVHSHDTSSSMSHQPTNERTSSNSETSSSQSKEMSSKNTDSAVVTNADVETKHANSNFNTAACTANSEDTNFDLDEQSILTYVF